MEYPELQVVPRASQRIVTESKRESEQSQWIEYAPIQLGSAMLFAGGLTHALTAPSDTESQRMDRLVGSSVAMGVGTGWMALTAWMAASYRPYTSAVELQGSVTGTGKREVLTRERMAESSIAKAARNGRILSWGFALSQAAASITLLNSTNSVHQNLTPVIAGGALVMSLAPVIFPFHWQQVEGEQSEYKKRIFTPVAFNAAVLPSADGKNPMLSTQLQFVF